MKLQSSSSTPAGRPAGAAVNKRRGPDSVIDQLVSYASRKRGRRELTASVARFLGGMLHHVNNVLLVCNPLHSSFGCAPADHYNRRIVQSMRLKPYWHRPRSVISWGVPFSPVTPVALEFFLLLQGSPGGALEEQP